MWHHNHIVTHLSVIDHSDTTEYQGSELPPTALSKWRQKRDINNKARRRILYKFVIYYIHLKLIIV